MEPSLVGKNVPRLDGPELATGQARFTADIVIPLMLHGRILRSPHPHARVICIDTSRAIKTPGVKAVLTGQDVPRIKYGYFPDEYALAVDKVRFAGDEVAAVAATSEDAAAEALDLIKVEYEVLPAVFDPVEAMRPGAPQIHKGVERNLGVNRTLHWGDVEAGFRESDYIREDTFAAQAQLHCAMEPHAAIASCDTRGRLTVWSCTQGTYRLVKQLSLALDMPVGKIRVIKPNVGGGFGGKWDMVKTEICTSLLALRTGRPVRIVYDREEVFLATRQRHPMQVTIKTGVKRDGTLVAKDCTIIADGGGYNSVGPIVVVSTGTKLAMLYRIPHVRYTGQRVYTNNPVAGAFRGFGQVQLRLADESQLDIIARDLQIDPLELRLKNALRPNSVTANGALITSCGFAESLERVGELSEWHARRRQRRDCSGLGMACNMYGSGGVRSFDRPDSSTAFVKISEDGSVTVLTGVADIGQGAETTMAILAAEALGVPIADVKVVAGDTAATPPDNGTFASRVTFIAGNAVVAAAADARRQLFGTVADHLEARLDDLDLKDGRVYVKGSPDRSIGLVEAVGMSIKAGRGLDVLGKGSYTADRATYNTVTGIGNLSAAYSFGAQAFELQIDPETGQIEVPRVAAAYDCGRALNPMALAGQIEGSVLCGIGQALYEQRVSQDGHTLNPSFAAYAVPTALETPAVQTGFIEPLDPAGPFGAKGMSEGAQVPPTAAISNAIFDATGAHINQLPFTPERVLQALEDRGT